MSATRVTIFACDRCGHRNEQTEGGQPPGWIAVTETMPVLATFEKERVMLCPSCRAAWQRFLERDVRAAVRGE